MTCRGTVSFQSSSDHYILGILQDAEPLLRDVAVALHIEEDQFYVRHGPRVQGCMHGDMVCMAQFAHAGQGHGVGCRGTVHHHAMPTCVMQSFIEQADNYPEVKELK